VPALQIENCPLEGLKLVRPAQHADARGFFMERFNARLFAEAGLPSQFVQDNHSRSLPGVLRGLHYQLSPAQGKLVGVVRGRIWDVAVDIRPGSATFGQYYGVEISGDNGLLFWIPAGFAHGFCVLGDEPADLLYKLDAPYNPAGEGGIRFDDAELAIAWPVPARLLSDRDRGLPTFRDYCRAQAAVEASA
jgi:dTDP-4-dehydrorhamnose 3,5-epimerase